MQQGSIYEKILWLSSKTRTFLEFSNFHKKYEAEENPRDRPSQNTLSHFYPLAQFPLITSATELGYYRLNLNIYKLPYKLLND